MNMCGSVVMECGSGKYRAYPNSIYRVVVIVAVHTDSE